MSESREVKAGDIFEVNGGTITVLHYKSKKSVYVMHNDEYSHCMWAAASSIKEGQVKNPYFRSVEGVGFLGVGDFKCSINGKVTEEYTAWRSMLVRCYNKEFLSKNPTYQDCSVCDDWHNFQNFSYWYTREDESGRGHAVDKDILVKGNRIYSPKNCCLIPKGLNSFFSDFTKNEESLKGVGETKSGKFITTIRRNRKKKRLGTYKTKEEAKSAYSREKAIIAKELAIIYKADIRYKVFLAIMNWEF